MEDIQRPKIITNCQIKSDEILIACNEIFIKKV